MPTPRHLRATAVAGVVMMALGACSGDDATSGDEFTVATSSSQAAGDTAPAGSSTSTRAPTTSTGAAGVTATETLPTVPAVGVPGLDSDDLVCRSWSRFGGSFQVVAVAASFGGGDPVDTAALEIVAAPVVVDAYDELLANWPEELETERELVADRFLGPFARRATTARGILVAAGADEAMLDVIREAWLAALAARNPEQPDLAVDLPDDVWPVVDAAAVELGATLVPVPADPSLVTDVEVPLTEQFLAEHCPDRGTLGGGDVDVDG